MFQRILKCGFIPTSIDAGLLFLRVTVCVSLFLKHGYMKIAQYSYWATPGNFADPLHIGQVPSLVISLLTETIGCALIIVGFATRWASLWAFSVVFVAWALKGHFEYFGHGNPGDHGEATVFYLLCMITIFLTGPGRFSIDAKVKGDCE